MNASLGHHHIMPGAASAPHLLAHAARSGDLAALQSITDPLFDWMRALTEAVEAGHFTAARWIVENRKPPPSYRYSAGNLAVLAYCAGDKKQAQEVREWYGVTLADLRENRHRELLHLVRSHRMALVQRWVEDFGISAEDLLCREPAPVAYAAHLLPTNWLWELSVHCDQPTLAWLLSRGVVTRASLQQGHATLARSFNSDERVAPWIESIVLR